MNSKYVALVIALLMVSFTIYFVSRQKRVTIPSIPISLPSLPILPPFPVPIPNIPTPMTPPSTPSPIVPATPKTVFVFDIDKTLASVDGNSGLPITDLKPNPVMLEKAKSAEILVIATARDDKYKSDTLKWISKIGLKPALTFFRPPNDTRPDPDVKYDQMKEIKLKYPTNPIIMYDDKPENCNAVTKFDNVKCYQP
jgi:hypothetical protein